MRISQIIAPRASEVIEVDDPVPSPGQVVVDVLACGVCTSDRMPWAERGTRDAPIRLGHEIVGRIRTLAPDVTSWNVGDVVTGLGDGGFATRAAMNADAILPVPYGIPPELAIGEPLADLEEALARTNPTAGDRIAIVGLGFMGLALVQLAHHRAPSVLIGVDPSPEARERALKMGADLAFHPDELPPEFSTGSDAAHELRMDIVVEAVGATPALTTASTLVRPYGTLCVVGYHHDGTAPMDMELWYKGATVVNGFCPQRPRLMKAMADALQLVASHRFTYAPLITHRFGLDEVDAAYELMESRSPDFVKSVIIPAG